MLDRQQTIVKVTDEVKRSELSQLTKNGFDSICISCSTPYKGVPTENYEDGHGGRALEMCRCGCDILTPIYKMLDYCYRIESKPVLLDNKMTHIVKEHNFVHCNCIGTDGRKNMIHYGDTEEECGGKSRGALEEVGRDGESVTLHCKKSDYNIIILKDTEDERKMSEKEYSVRPISKW